MSEKKLAVNEYLKTDSDYLRGTIQEGLDTAVTGAFSEGDQQLIKFHGFYQQDDRDLRNERKEQKLEPLYSFMLRARVAGGVCSPQQWLAVDDIASNLTSSNSIRLTTRQTFQYHGIPKRNLKTIIQDLDREALDSIAACGDVNRNVMCNPNPVESKLHQQAYAYAKQLSDNMLPHTKAYAEIWLDGEKLATTDEEPILGSNYLPRKFKTTVVIPPQNDVDVHANDLNFIAIAKDGKLVGFNVLVGGGLAMTHGDTSTYARKADDFGFVPLDKTLDVAAAVVTTQRDWGNRSDRKNAKTKYTLDRVGIDVFKAEVEKRAGVVFSESRPYEFTGRGDRIGWAEGIDGKHHLALFIENGRLLDFPGKALKTGVAEIAKIHKGDFRMTANQNLIVAGVPKSQKAQIEKLARQYGLMDDAVSEQRKNSMACVAFPTCPLAMAEAERFLPEFVTDVEDILKKHGLPEEDNIILRITGCPNGCGRAMLAELGLVGKAPGRYNMHLGGNKAGTRIPKMYKENITSAQILEEIDSLVGRWATERNDNEGFGDFTIRAGIIEEVIISKRDLHA